MTGIPLVATNDTAPGFFAAPQHMQRVLELGLANSRSFHWPTQIERLPELDGEAFRFTDHDGEQQIWIVRDQLSAFVRMYGGQVNGNVTAGDAAQAALFVDELVGAIPHASVPEGEVRVPVTFWTLGQHGPTSRSRTLEVHKWDDVDGNYVDKTAADLRGLMNDFTPGAGGQLIVWHGPPGTGKTSALRALAWQWREWCSLHYVTDPETFFGDRAAYMLEVLLDEDVGPQPLRAPGEKPPEDEPRERWRLLVLEDTGELLARDAKDRTGQGLARLLNVVDGLIGQGLRILVLVTTNEELRALHPAIQRPGRCASKIEFAPFDRGSAYRWLREHDAQGDHVEAQATLADLYAQLSGRDTSAVREAAPVGFAGAVR